MEMTELAKRLRAHGETLAQEAEDKWTERHATDLLAAAEVVERSEWRPISGKLEIPEEGILVGKWVEDEWWTEKVDCLDWAVNAEFTHYYPIPAPPEVKP